MRATGSSLVDNNSIHGRPQNSGYSFQYGNKGMHKRLSTINGAFLSFYSQCLLAPYSVTNATISVSFRISLFSFYRASMAVFCVLQSCVFSPMQISMCTGVHFPWRDCD